MLRLITFASKSLLGGEKRYSNMEWKALGILDSLKKFHHYCFTRKVSIITDHKPLVAILKKENSNTIKMTTANPPQNTPIQSQNNIPHWSRSLHSRMAVQTKP